MKARIQKMLQQQRAKLAGLVSRSQACQDVAELRSINTEVDGVKAEIRQLEEMLEEVEAQERRAADPVEPPADPVADEGESRSADPVATPGPEERTLLATYGMGMTREERDAAIAVFEQRGADLRAKKPIEVSYIPTPEERAVTVATGTIVETKYSRTLNETFNEVSTLIDRVNAIPLMGGNAYQKGFEVSFGEGDYTAETADYTETDPTVDYVEIGKAKITAYTEITDEATVLPNVDYQALVVKNVRIALRKKITKQLLIGAGTTNTITGIFNAPTNVIPAAYDLDFADIDADTLDEIVLSYGGDEDIEGGAYLVINKATLKNFAKVRSTDGKKLYKITIAADQNSGTISSEESWNVPYILNSAVAGFDDVVEDAYWGAYGKPAAYEMPIFSAMTIEESRDYKFRSGQIAYRGAVWVGGNVVKYKGWMRLVKNAVA